MRKISEYSGFGHENAGLIIVVASVPLASTVLEIGSRVYGRMRNMKVVKTIEEARQLIEKHSKAA